MKSPDLFYQNYSVLGGTVFGEAYSGGEIVLLNYYNKNIENKNERMRFINLPNEIESIKISLLQIIPSATILICQFFLTDKSSKLLDNDLRKNYKTYSEEIKNGYKYTTVKEQKENTVNLTLEYLNSVCSDWLKINFSGLYASVGYQEAHPVCNLITFKKYIPFSDEELSSGFISILELDNEFDTWKSDEENGLYLKLPYRRNYTRQKLLLFGNSSEILNNNNMSRFGITKEEDIIYYPWNLDKTFANWILNTLLDFYIQKIASLRDSYGKVSIDNTKNDILQIRKLDYQVLQIKKNVLPLNIEIKSYIENEKLFFWDDVEFHPVDGRFKNEKLFVSIRNKISKNIQLLSGNEQILGETSKAHRELSTIISNEKLSESNSAVQRWMLRLTIAMLVLTIITNFDKIIIFIKWLGSFFVLP